MNMALLKDIDNSLSDDIKRKIYKNACIHPMIDLGIYSFSFNNKDQIIRGPDYYCSMNK